MRGYSIELGVQVGARTQMRARIRISIQTGAPISGPTRHLVIIIVCRIQTRDHRVGHEIIRGRVGVGAQKRITHAHRPISIIN